MTLLVDGCGTQAYRVSIDGCPSEAVTHPSMVAAGSAGVRARIDGLVMVGQKFDVKVDPLACKLTVGGISVRMVDIDGTWSAIFDKAPQNTTWLTADVSKTATTIPVGSTTGFAASGYVWIDSECITYTSVDATNFLGCTRGSLSDDADAETYHYTTDGARMRSPEVTDWPVLWEGRRVRVYRYEEGDALTGNGTQVYLGVISTSPSSNGTSWSIGVDSISSIMEGMLGADLSEPAYPRGIYYPPETPVKFDIVELSTAYVYNSSPVTTAHVVISGFYETQEAFVTALQTVIDNALTAASVATPIKARSDGAAGWHLEAKTLAGGAAVAVVVLSSGMSLTQRPWGRAGDMIVTGSGGVSPVDASMGAAGGPQTEAGAVVDLVVASANYYYWPGGASLSPAGSAPSLGPSDGVPGAGTVPRGVYIETSAASEARTIYLGGSAPVSSLATSVEVGWGGDGATRYEVESQSTAQRAIVLTQVVSVGPAGGPTPGVFAFTASSLPPVRFGLLLCEDMLGSSSAGFLDTIVASQQQYSTLGVVPMLRTGDYDAAGWVTAASVGQPAMVTRRVYSTFGPISLNEIIRPELQLAGCFLSVDSTGRLVPKRMRLAAASETSATSTIGQTTLLTDKSLLSHEVAGLGQINQILMRTGYNAQTDDYSGRTVIVRDVSAFGQSPAVRQITIEPKSEYVGPAIVDDDMVAIAAGFFGAFGGSYAIDTIDVATHDGVEVGDPIVYDHPHMPDEDGAIGVVGKVGIVLGRSAEAYSPRVRLTVLSTKQKVGGYAPGSLVTKVTDLGGDQWEVSTAEVMSDFIAAADRVMVVAFNDASAVSQFGTVASDNGGMFTVQFDGAIALVASEWYMTIAPSDDTDGLADTQRRFTHVAGTDGAVSYTYAPTTAPSFRIAT